MVGEVGRRGSSSLSRLYHTRLATPFYSHKEISKDKMGVASDTIVVALCEN